MTSPFKLQKICTTLSSIFKLQAGRGLVHDETCIPIPQWAADHIYSTGSIPSEYQKRLMDVSDRAECFTVKWRDDAPGLYVIFYIPEFWIH